MSSAAGSGGDLRAPVSRQRHAPHLLPGRYCATERRRRHGYPSFSIMKWFRRGGKRCGDGDGGDDADPAWFRDDLMRIRQAYARHEPDYAAVTPVAARHRGTAAAAATWSRWSGSTTTVYSFAYVDGGQVQDERRRRRRRRRSDDGEDDEDDDDDDEVEEEEEDEDEEEAVVYIDAATLPVPRRRFDGARCPASASSPSATSSGRATGTMTSTYRRRSYKKAAPPPPPPTPSTETTTAQRRTATVARKKYRAPQPPTQPAADAQRQADRRPAVRLHRRKKGPAPKPPVQQQQHQQQQHQQQQQQQQQARPDADGRSGSNVRRKISQFERERLMQRVDKIERHFLPKNATAKAAAKDTATAHPGFATPAALYSAMAATNLTELDKRAAEICRLRKAAARPSSTMFTDDHKNAIVAAVLRKSYPSTSAAAAAAAEEDERRPDDGALQPKEAADDLRLVRRKRLAFFQQRAGASDRRRTVHGDAFAAEADAREAKVTVEAREAKAKAAVEEVKATAAAAEVAKATAAAAEVAKAAAAEEAKAKTAVKAEAVAAIEAKSKTAAKTSGRAAAKSSFGTQTVGSVVEAKTLSRTRTDARGPGSSSDTIKLPSEDNNCYQQLMAMEMQSDLVLHYGPFECAVCLCTYDNNGVVLRDCLHVFCRPCLQMTIAHSNAEQVECPYIDEQYSCKGVLQHREIKKILDADEEYERFLQRSVDRARQLLAKERNGASFQCRRPDCTGWCMIYDKHQVLEFKCPVCGTVTCVQCGSIHTQKEGCKKNNDINNSDGGSQDTLENLIGRGDAMLCPGCNTVLSKQQGCDWIKCAVCFLEICWATKGPRWGPKGKGDTTGGCMCGIPPGRKCHTDCKYCH